jgi:translation initiation factor IF-1
VSPQDDTDAEQRRSGLTVEGVVREVLLHAMFVVELDGGQRVTAHVGGTLKTTLIRLVPGDRVTVALSPYDLSRGRITKRLGPT